MVFNGDKHYCTTVNLVGPPSEAMFKQTVTKLQIQMTVRISDNQIRKEMIDKREDFKKKHKGHGNELRFTTKDQIEENYFVGKSSIPPENPRVYQIFTYLGHSLLYRWAKYFMMKEIKYNIEHKISSEKQIATTKNKKLFVRVISSDKIPFYDLNQTS